MFASKPHQRVTINAANRGLVVRLGDGPGRGYGLHITLHGEAVQTDHAIVQEHTLEKERTSEADQAS